MDFVVDIQGLKDKHNKFIPKEVAFVSLQGSITGHWLISPPHEFDELRSDLRTTNDYVSSRMHGLQWFDGEISMRKLKLNFYNIARRANRIYVRGYEKARLLQVLMSRPIINLEDYDTLSFSDLERRFPCEQLCCFHFFDENPSRRHYCALRRAYLTKSWFQSILPEEQNSKTTKTTSEIYYNALNSQLYRRQTRTRFQDDGAYGNDVCDCQGSHCSASNSDSDDTHCEILSDVEEETLTAEETQENEHQPDKKSIGGPKRDDHRSLCG